MSTDTVKEHYSPPDLLARIEEGLRKTGKTRDTITLDDLAPVDELHLRSTAATIELIELLDPSSGMHVLDLGSGIGGPARWLGKTTGCRVTGIDLSNEYCTVGTALNAWLGLDEQITLVPGDATDMERFDTASFDAAWTIHTGMNIADKDAFYTETARVLKPDARLVVYDILGTGGQDIRFPVPWAKDGSTSFLASLDELSVHLAKAGFEVMEKRDQTAEALAFVEQGIAQRRQAESLPPLGLHIVLGPDFPVMIENLWRNLAEGRIAVAVIRCRRLGAT